MEVEIISPEGKIFSGSATYVGLPGADGDFGILKDHAPLISELKAGKVIVRDSSGTDQPFDVAGGVIEVRDNKITILAE